MKTTILLATAFACATSVSANEITKEDSKDVKVVFEKQVAAKKLSEKEMTKTQAGSLCGGSSNGDNVYRQLCWP